MQCFSLDISQGSRSLAMWRVWKQWCHLSDGCGQSWQWSVKCNILSRLLLMKSLSASLDQVISALSRVTLHHPDSTCWLPGCCRSERMIHDHECICSKKTRLWNVRSVAVLMQNTRCHPQPLISSHDIWLGFPIRSKESSSLSAALNNRLCQVKLKMIFSILIHAH